MRWPRPSASRLFALWCVAVALLLTTVVVPAVADFDVPESVSGQGRTREGTVTAVLERQTSASARGELTSERLAVAVDGHSVTIERSRAEGDIGWLELNAGDRVLVASAAGPGGETFFIVDRVRRMPLWALAAVFVLLVLVVGRMTGAWSLLGLAASILVIFRFVLPGILSGHSAVLIAVTGATVIMGTTLLLAHGSNRKTGVALGATALSLLLTSALAELAIRSARFTGLASEDDATLQVLSAGAVSAEGLLLAGIIIGALGVLDDVTVAQASAVFELRRANRLLGARELYARAMNIGRDHIASTVNTLVLAYAGASLPLLMLLVLQGDPLGIQTNREFVATEIVRTLVGSIGIVAAVPLTTALAAGVAARFGPGGATEVDRAPPGH